METLSENQRDAILLVQLMHVKVSDAAERMRRTEQSVSGLVRRGIDNPRIPLPEYNPANLRGRHAT